MEVMIKDYYKKDAKKKQKGKGKNNKKAWKPDKIRRRYNEEILKTWVDVFGDEDFLTYPLIIPVNEFDDKNKLPDEHWFLIVLDVPNAKLYLMDSAGESINKRTKRWCNDFLKLFTTF